MTDGQRCAPVLEWQGATIRHGTCSWTDRTLVKETDWYPRKSMKAAERLAYYASKFPLVEVDSTYYFPPTPEVAQQWAERTPPGFTMDVKAWSLLTGHPTFPASLWPDLLDEVRPELRDRKNLYATHLSADALAECWARFRHALLPLHRAGRLGGVLLQFPPWFHPGSTRRAELVAARAALPDFPLFVEFRNGRWLDGDECDDTLSFLEDNGLTYVCVDEPQGFESSVPPVVATTTDIAVARFHGRNRATWEPEDEMTPAERFSYDYDVDELTDWVPRLQRLADAADDVHVLMNNCYRDFAVTNGRQLSELLRAAGATETEATQPG